MNLVELVHSKRADRLFDALLEGLWRYFRVEVVGAEMVPATGPAVIAPNHSGYAAADAILLARFLHQGRHRMPRILAHRAFFEWFRLVRLLSESFGMREASIQNGVDLLRNGELMLIFPEGEAGNFKPSRLRYRLQRFHTGFVRMAVLAGAPIIPCLVIGAEESHLCLGSIDFSRLIGRFRVPVPVNLFPLPARWKIVFLDPIDLSGYRPEDAADSEKMKRLAGELRARMQRALRQELRSRKSVYF